MRNGGGSMSDRYGTSIRPRGLPDTPIYLDYNATTPVDPRVVDAMLPYLTTHFGNPSSTHGFGDEPRDAVETARAQVARLVGSAPDDIVVTGSGSEANALAIRGAVLGHHGDRDTPCHVITQQTEHPAVLRTCRSLQRLHNVDVTYLPVGADGLVDPDAVASAISTRTVLVSVMYANNETGTIQPIAELARIAHERDVLFHTDAAQAVGKVPVDVDSLDVDLLTLVGHKMYAPKGIGALFVRPGTHLEPLVCGGGQERGRRAGTENVCFAVALGAAAELAAADLAAGEPDRVRLLRDELHRRLVDRLPGTVLLNGHGTERLPNTVNLAVVPFGGNDLLAAAPDVAASTGSACHAGNTQPSPVLIAMGRALPAAAMPSERAQCAVRFSLGRWTTADDIERAVQRLDAACRSAGARRIAAVGQPTRNSSATSQKL
jgi:cysteine desulfurase